MPEAAVSTTPPAAPETTASIVEAAAADLHNSESPDSADSTNRPHSGSDHAAAGAAGAGTGPVQSSVGGVPPVQSAAATQADVDELAAALGIADRQGTDRWTSRIAYSKVKKVVGELQSKAKAEHEAALKQHADRLSVFEQQVARFDQLVNDPEVLLANLAQIHPAYRRFLGGQPHQDAANQPPQKIETLEDLQRVIDHQVAQRLAPIEQERHARLYAEKMTPVIQAQLDEAKTWPLFVESHQEILAVLNKYPQAGLRDAYQQVVIPKLTAGRDKMRQEVLAELNARPHASTVTSTVPGRTAPDTGPQETADIVREALRNFRE